MSTEQRPASAWPPLHDASRAVAVALGIVVYRLRVHGRDHIPATGPVVMVANHSAMIDGPLLLGLLHRRTVFLVKSDMFSGVLGWFLLRIGQLPVGRGEPDRTPLLDAVRVLRAGGVVGAFPEGARGTGDVANAHNGAAWLARSGGAVLLPVACHGTRRPPGARRRFRPRVDVLVGEPFAASAAGAARRSRWRRPRCGRDSRHWSTSWIPFEGWSDERS